MTEIVDRVKSKVEQLVATLNKLNEENNSLREEMAAYKTEKETQQLKFNELQEELNKYKVASQDANQKGATLKLEQEELKACITDLVEEIDDCLTMIKK